MTEAFWMGALVIGAAAGLGIAGLAFSRWRRSDSLGTPSRWSILFAEGGWALGWLKLRGQRTRAKADAARAKLLAGEKNRDLNWQLERDLRRAENER